MRWLLARLRLWVDAGEPGDPRPLRERVRVFLGVRGRW